MVRIGVIGVGYWGPNLVRCLRESPHCEVAYICDRDTKKLKQICDRFPDVIGVTDPAEVERWGVVGLLHDFDYEQNPTEDRHLHVGGRILRERGYDEEMVRTIESHANYMNVPRDTPMKKAIFACDELVGFIGACVKVRPSKAIADLPVSSVLKRLKDKAFARAVSRDDVQNGADGLPRPLEEHVSFTMEALKRIAPEIGL